MKLVPGNKAPDFILKDTEGNDVSLSDIISESNALLLFFPLAYTGVCTKEMCYMRDNLSRFETLNAKVIGISVDSFFTLKEFKKAHNLNFMVLSDFNKVVSTAYQAIYDDFFGMQGVSKRAAFIVDTGGIIRYSDVLEKPSDLPDFDEIHDALATLVPAF
jgi:glutaredoxin-dependent peroxiredoxin